jgi:hypothetical protein
MKAVIFSGLLLASVLASALSAQAQVIIISPGRFYAGAQTFQSQYEVFYPTTPGMVGIKPWQIVAGMYLVPRLAIQLGYAYSGDEFHEDPSYIGTTTTGKSTYGWRSSESYEQVVPLLLRYSLIRTLHPR